MRSALIWFAVATLIIACVPIGASEPTPISSALQPTDTPTPTRIPLNQPSSTATFPATPPVPLTVTLPPQEALWQIQYVGEIDTTLDVNVFNLDLLDTPPSTIEALHRHNVFVMCYFSAGSYEEWRPDADKFPAEVLGKDLEGWPGEKWLDIRRMDLLAPIIEARLDLAVSKGCHGVDPDNVNGYDNDTGFSLTYADQIRYNNFLAEAAHERGLSIGLKNDLKQIPDLISSFDWLLNEECFFYQECELLLPFVKMGKPVFVIEYELEPSDFCPQALQMNVNALHKNWELDAYRVDCREWSDGI